MEDKKHKRTLGMLVVCAMLGACSIHGPMDTPYDPDFPKETLFDQIPNNEGDALARCAGHLPPSERQPHQTGRC
jgi:hypothetical protein